MENGSSGIFQYKQAEEAIFGKNSAILQRRSILVARKIHDHRYCDSYLELIQSV
jgi:hypothetical protein